MLFPTMVMTLRVMNVQEKSTQVLDLMELVRKMMMGMIQLLKSTIKCNFQEIALPVAT